MSAVSATPSQATDAGAPTGRPASIADFLTDGSLAALCPGLSRLTGAAVELRDPEGRLIIPGTGQPGPGNWKILESDQVALPTGDSSYVPLKLGARPIGWITVAPGQPALGEDARQRLESAL